MRFPRLSVLLMLVAAPAVAQPAGEPVEAEVVPAEAVVPEPEVAPVTTAEPVAAPEPAPADVTATAAEAEWSDPSLEDDTSESLQLHGWVSQGVMASVENNYLANTTDGSFEFFEAGINVTKELGSDLRAGVQIFAQDLGPIGNYEPVIDWAYIDYRRKPSFAVRAGKFKMPLYLYNERMDTDMTRTAVLMPQAVYDQHYRDVLNAISGFGVYGTVELGGAGSLDYDVYVGAAYIQPRGAVYAVENVAGTRVIWDAPSCMRASAHALYANFTATTQLDDASRDAIIMAGGAAPGWNGTVVQSFDDWKMLGGALECTTERWTLTAEAGVWDAKTTTTPMLSAPGKYRELRSYVQAEHRINDRLSAALYLSAYAQLDGTDPASADDRHQYDLAASVRYDLTPNWLVKGELHGIDGFGLTEVDLNQDRERAATWGMFLAKTTLTF